MVFIYTEQRCFILINYLQIDSFATARDNETHEATRRVLSVLLRQVILASFDIIMLLMLGLSFLALLSSFSLVQIDGFEQDKKVVVIAATNRKQDLDPALIR